jgi:hypothetical protein
MARRSTEQARRSGWRQWKAGEARAMLGAWQKSGLPLAAFARQRGLRPRRLQYWQQRLGACQAENAEKPLLLVPATVTGLPFAAGAAAVTVNVAGVLVEINDAGAVPAAWVAALVSGLARPAA